MVLPIPAFSIHPFIHWFSSPGTAEKAIASEHFAMLRFGMNWLAPLGSASEWMDTLEVLLLNPLFPSFSPFSLSRFPRALALLTFMQNQQIKHYGPHGASALAFLQDPFDRSPRSPLFPSSHPPLLSSSPPPLLPSSPPPLLPSSSPPLPPALPSPVCLGVRACVNVCVVGSLSSIANIIIILLCTPRGRLSPGAVFRPS